MKRAVCFIVCLFLICPALAGEAPAQIADAAYFLASLIEAREGEEAVLALETSYYSGETVYKGATSQPLTGACALHCAAVVITNLKGETVTAQQVAKANNISKTSPKYWRAFVAWGKLESAYRVRFGSFDMAQYGSRLKANGVKTDERRQSKLDALRGALDEKGAGVGLIVHFNSTGKLNGEGKKHAVVILGYIRKDGVVTDLLISDSSVAPPRGACVRLSESSLPLSMLGEKKLGEADADTLALRVMDYVVSYRYIEKKPD